jgi:predicted DNA binding CopG/RHH family protein
MDDRDARRPAVTPGPTTAAPARTKRLTLDLPESLHRAIKVSAAQDGVTMAEKLRALLLKHYGLDT